MMKQFTHSLWITSLSIKQSAIPQIAKKLALWTLMLITSSTSFASEHNPLTKPNNYQAASKISGQASSQANTQTTAYTNKSIKTTSLGISKLHSSQADRNEYWQQQKQALISKGTNANTAVPFDTSKNSGLGITRDAHFKLKGEQRSARQALNNLLSAQKSNRSDAGVTSYYYS